MMKVTTNTYQNILMTARRLFAQGGYDGLSMRLLSKEVGIALSVIYHYFPDKDVLLEELYKTTNHQLGLARQHITHHKTMSDELRTILDFQFKHIEEIVFVLKYYLHYRRNFKKNEHGWTPEKTALHIEEVLYLGQQTGELREEIDIQSEAKIIAHAINGFLLEYYPAQPRGKEKAALIAQLHRFIMRSISELANARRSAYA